jgi:predicted metal-dependent HD superfamily phosphohydrolase
MSRTDEAGDAAAALSLPPAGEVEYIAVRTTGAGPFAEDLFFLLFTPTQVLQIPNAAAAPLFDWMKQLPEVDFEAAILASGCTDERLFILWRKSGAPNFGVDAPARLQRRLVERLEARGVADANRIADGVVAAYRQPHRHYHGLRHIHHCLWEFDRLSGMTIDRELVELAIWYHDVVYAPLRGDNETRSVERLRADLGAALPPESLARLSAMILATARDGRPIPDDEAVSTLLDIDLAVLALAPVEFAAYESAVVAEFAAAPRLVFRYQRKRFLKRLLARELFLTEAFHASYEQRARKNLTKLLQASPYRWIPVRAQS